MTDTGMLDAKTLAAALKSPIEKLISYVTNNLKQTFSNRIIEYQEEEFKRCYLTKTIIHNSEPISLFSFYEPLHLNSFPGSHGKGKRIATHSLAKLTEKSPYITLIGSAGSGKSTIVKFWFINCIMAGDNLPIKIELRYLNETEKPLHTYIFDEVFKFQNLGFDDQIIHNLLSTGNFVFFFDGYDEVLLAKKPKVTKDIDGFVKKYPKNKYIVTSRPHTDIDALPLFTNFEVCDLSDEEIASFVRKQIPTSESEIAEKIIKSVTDAESSELKSFLSNPLLLSMYILTFRNNSTIPKKRCDFYLQVFETLYSRHDNVSKMAFVREQASGLSKDQFEELLRLFSFISFFEDKFFFSLNYLNTKIDFIKDKRKHLQFENSKLLHDLQISIAILNKDGLDYVFPHRSMQEYFAALYVTKLSLENKKQIYAKQFQDAKENNILILDRLHYFRLLSELDYFAIATYLALPLLKHLSTYLRTIKTLTDAQCYLASGTLYLVCNWLLRTRIQHPEVQALLFPEPFSYTWFLDENRKHDYLAAANGSHHSNIASMRKLAETFNAESDMIQQKLKEAIDANDKGDNEIINML